MENFTPIIEQDGFQQEINYLSGGEKNQHSISIQISLNNICTKGSLV